MYYISIESSGNYPGHVYIDLGTGPWMHGIAFWLSGEGIVRHHSGMGVKVDSKNCVRFIKGEPPDNHVGIAGATKIVGGAIAAERTVGDRRYLAIRSDYDHSIDIAILSKDGGGVDSFVLQIRPEGIYRYGYVSKLLGLPVDGNGRLQINRKIR